MRCKLLLAATLLTAPLLAQTTPAPIVRTEPAHTDPTLDTAASLIGRPLFLRCFCADNTLAFDAAGHTTSTKATDWTLAAADIKLVERKSPTEIEFTGVRVAMRYAADRHEWERHPQADEKLRLTVADPGTPAVLTRTLDRIFAQGIDLPLQRAMPPFWQHYFNPQLPWLDAAGNPDHLTGTKVFLPTAPAAPDPTTAAVATHKAEPTYTPPAQHDHVKGSLTLRFIVDPTGTPERIAVLTPLGYGLDAATVAAVERFHFTPGTHAGKPVAVPEQVTQEFILVTPPH